MTADPGDIDDLPEEPPAGRSALESLRWTFGLILWGIGFGFHLLQRGTEAVGEWFLERPAPALYRGIPAVMVAAMLIVTVVAGREIPRTDLIQHYRKSVSAAVRREDWDAARLWQQKVIWLNPGAAEHQFSLAVVAERHGDRDRAREIMHAIAPSNEPGFPDAHYWLANDLISQDLPLTEQLRQLLEYHLTIACQSELAGADAHARLGQLLLYKGDTAGAVQHFEQARTEHPEVTLTLSALYREQGRIPDALSAARQAAQYFANETSRAPDDWESRHRWVQAEVFAERYQRAVAALEARPASINGAPVAQAYVNIYVSWYDYVLRHDDRNLALQLDLLKRALDYGPDNPTVLIMIADMATREWDGAVDAETLLTKALARGTAPTMVHFILGTRALQKGDLDQARMHLELAHDKDPRLPAILNNLAWTISVANEPDHERALKLVDLAIELSPRPEFMITRSDILAMMKRFPDAVTQLEDLLRQVDDPTPLHQRLAALYEELGSPDIAAQHRLRADARKTRTSQSETSTD